MANSGQTNRLLALLRDAEQRLRSVSVDDTWSCLSRDQFIGLVSTSRVEIAEGNLAGPKAEDLWRAFAPTCDWDDMVGDVELGNAVFELIEGLYGRPPAST